MSDLLNIDVVYALPERQTVLRIRVAPATSVLAAIEQSGIVQKHPEIDLSVNKFGIYSRPVKGADLLQDGDRIEIYRPLIADPKEMRKKRAEKAKEEGRADAVTGGRPNANRKRGDTDPA
ncbi:MAG: RnfH family protein [Aeromonas popoffii]|uniref:RnfH family protein n=1 Tax=Aeromonas TaxID=642 RepID=UPI000D356B71|nr:MULTISPECIES: RnfH family protein [unclassified Aeromonas]PTT48232.1 RnfH family protein [Aeromonas sp. HMWF014]